MIVSWELLSISLHFFKPQPIPFIIFRGLLQFMMANGALVRVLIHTDVTKYLNFKAVDGNFVYNKGKVCDQISVPPSTYLYQFAYYVAKFSSLVMNLVLCFQIHKVPANDVEALKSPLMGLFEKRRARKFFIYVQDYEDSDPKSHEGLDLNKVTARDLIS